MNDNAKSFEEQVEETIKSLESFNQAVREIQQLEEERKAVFRKMIRQDSKRKK